MKVSATVTGKGQITIPAEVRRALDLHPGDRVLFHVLDGGVVLGAERDLGDKPDRVPETGSAEEFFALAGTVSVPAEVDPEDWSAQREAAWRDAAARMPIWWRWQSASTSQRS